MSGLRSITRGLGFPEGPVELEDGSLAVVELRNAQVTRVALDGSKAIIAKTGGGPNGMAWGPGGLLFICNNGGSKFLPDHVHSIGPADDYSGGSIQTLDPSTGEVTTLYSECDGNRLSSPNDLVFDRHGGFYFTDSGKRFSRTRDHGALYYAQPDGSSITELVIPVLTPNGIALSPDECSLYFAETESGRLWAFDIEAPGVIKKLDYPAPADADYLSAPSGARLIANLGGFSRFDSIAVDEEGNIAAGTLGAYSLMVISPQGEILKDIPMPDLNVTNVCFGGPERTTAYVTVSLSADGQLLEMDWPVPGLRLNFAP